MSVVEDPLHHGGILRVRHCDLATREVLEPEAGAVNVVEVEAPVAGARPRLHVEDEIGPEEETPGRIPLLSGVIERLGQCAIRRRKTAHEDRDEVVDRGGTDPLGQLPQRVSEVSYPDDYGPSI
jgi:hypothetical protein